MEKPENAASQHGDGALLFDQEEALGRVDGSAATLRLLIVEALPTIERELAALRRDAAPDAIARSLHTLKGLAATLGVRPLAEAALEAHRDLTRTGALEEGKLDGFRHLARRTLDALRAAEASLPRLSFSGLPEGLAALRDAINGRSLRSLDCAQALRDFLEIAGSRREALMQLIMAVELGRMREAVAILGGLEAVAGPDECRPR